MKAVLIIVGLLGFTELAFADRVTFAGSEDLREFDKLLEQNRRDPSKGPQRQSPTDPKMKERRDRPYGDGKGREEHEGDRGRGGREGPPLSGDGRDGPPRGDGRIRDDDRGSEGRGRDRPRPEGESGRGGDRSKPRGGDRPEGGTQPRPEGSGPRTH